MGLGQAVIVAGIGCRRNASAADILGAFDLALAKTGVTSSDVTCIATPAAKADEPGIAAAAAARGVLLMSVVQAAFEAAGRRTLSHSERALAVMGVPSVSEAAALAAAGANGRLLAPRVAYGEATCALAATGDTR